MPRATYSFKMSFWMVPPSGRRDALLLGDELVEQQQDRGRGVDRHRRRDLVEGDPVEQSAHVLERVDRDTDFADLAFGTGMIGVEPIWVGRSKAHESPVCPAAEQELEALVRRLGRSEAGVLAHRPEAAPVHVAPARPS